MPTIQISKSGKMITSNPKNMAINASTGFETVTPTLLSPFCIVSVIGQAPPKSLWTSLQFRFFACFCSAQIISAIGGVGKMVPAGKGERIRANPAGILHSSLHFEIYELKQFSDSIPNLYLIPTKSANSIARF